MADITIGNMKDNAALFMEKMGFAYDSEGLEMTDEQVVNFLLLCHQEMVMPEEEEEMEEMQENVKVIKVDGGDMRGVMDEILGHGSPKIGY